MLSCYRGDRMNVLENIHIHYDELTKKDKEIADYILEYPKKFCRQDINDFTVKMNISKSALIRFSKKLGYSGYSELRYELSRIIFTGGEKRQEAYTPIEIISHGYMDCLSVLIEELDPVLVEKIARKIWCANKIKVFGYNESALPPQHLAIRSTLLDLDLIVHTNRDYFTTQWNNMKKDDLVMIYSVKDNAKVYASLFEHKEVPVVIITMNPNRFNISDQDMMVRLPNPASSKVGLLDEQVLFYVFNEILLAQLMREKNNRGESK